VKRDDENNMANQSRDRGTRKPAMTGYPSGILKAPDLVGRPNTIDDFHKLWYPYQQVWWMGHEMQKCPMDLFMYQEIIYECKPDLIIECGTWRGGSALYMAHLCDLLNHGMVLTVDINRFVGFPQHSRIMYLTGSSVDDGTFKQVQLVADGFRKIMVILDSDHTKAHVQKELELYSPLVTKGQYLIVEDSNIHGHPVREDLPAGPFEAIEKWLPRNSEFQRDEACERFLLTFNPGGYLRRIS
jgi:cephalosporin hydroxylase